MIKAVAYARVSSREQEKEGFSIPSQLKLLDDYAANNGFEVVKQFSEAETAKQSGREEFGNLLEFLNEQQDVKVVLVEKTDRLYRNFKDYVRLEDLDLEIHFLKEGEVLSKDSRSHVKFIHGIKVLMAKNYIDNLSEEVKKGMYEKASQGHFPFMAPYGYKNNKETRMIEVDEVTAPFVKRAFQLYSSGNYSLSKLASALVEEGYEFKPGKPKIAKGTLESMLKNIFYTGDFMIKGKFFKGKHTPLVSIEEFDAAQSAFQRINRPKQVKRDFAFSGLMTCGHCGSAVTGQIKREKYIYYYCSGAKGHCNEPYHREESIVKLFSDAVKRISLTEDDVKWLTSALKEGHQDELAFHNAQVSSLQERYTRLTNRIDQIYEDKLDGKIPEELWLRKHEQYKSELVSVERSLAQHTKGNLDYVESGVQLLEIAKNAYTIYISRSPYEQRKMLNFFFQNISLKDGKLDIVWRKPFDWLANRGDCQEWWPFGDSNTGPHPYQACFMPV